MWELNGMVSCVYMYKGEAKRDQVTSHVDCRLPAKHLFSLKITGHKGVYSTRTYKSFVHL